MQTITFLKSVAFFLFTSGLAYAQNRDESLGVKVQVKSRDAKSVYLILEGSGTVVGLFKSSCYELKFRKVELELLENYQRPSYRNIDDGNSDLEFDVSNLRGFLKSDLANECDIHEYEFSDSRPREIVGTPLIARCNSCQPESDDLVGSFICDGFDKKPLGTAEKINGEWILSLRNGTNFKAIDWVTRLFLTAAAGKIMFDMKKVPDRNECNPRVLDATIATPIVGITVFSLGLWYFIRKYSPRHTILEESSDDIQLDSISTD